MTTITLAKRSVSIPDVVYVVLWCALIGGLWTGMTYRRPVVEPVQATTTIDMYAPARNADEQAAKDRIVWQKMADAIAEDFQ